MMVIINSRVIKNRLFYRGKRDSLFSEILNEKRVLWLHVPKNKGDQNQQYPVVYLLDAEEHFRLFTWMIKQFDGANGKRLFPDMIVVGILNSKRARDLTPTHSMIDQEGKNEKFFSLSGESEKFIGFIEKELIPHIDSSYPVASKRMLIGHSLGGLTAVNILLNHTGMFDGYVASDPSMWWDNKMMLDHARKALKEQRFFGKSLYISIANSMPVDIYMEQVRNDKSPKTNHIRCILELTDILENSHGNSLRFDYKYYKEHDHNAVPDITMFDGLRFLLGED
jgi:predicted alpha/beta superfamily hydrolase